MKLTYILLMTLGLGFLWTSSYAQKKGNSKEVQEEENIIDLPDWFDNSDMDTILKIEAQDSIDWADYIQLAVSYSQIEGEKSKIETSVENALKANTVKSCEMLGFILENRKDWKITKNHKGLISEKLKAYACR